MQKSRVIYPPKRPKLDLRSARKTVNSFFEKRRKSPLGSFYHDLALNLLVVVDAQLRSRRSLDLSDTMMREHLDPALTASQCRYLRVLLRDTGLVFVPEGKRSKKMGDYPQWLVRFSFFLKRTFTRKGASIPSYQPLYYSIRKTVVDDLYNELEEYEIRVTARDFWMRVNSELTRVLEARGLSREALKV